MKKDLFLQRTNQQNRQQRQQHKHRAARENKPISVPYNGHSDISAKIDI